MLNPDTATPAAELTSVAGASVKVTCYGVENTSAALAQTVTFRQTGPTEGGESADGLKVNPIEIQFPKGGVTFKPNQQYTLTVS